MERFFSRDSITDFFSCFMDRSIILEIYSSNNGSRNFQIGRENGSNRLPFIAILLFSKDSTHRLTNIEGFIGQWSDDVLARTKFMHV